LLDLLLLVAALRSALSAVVRRFRFGFSPATARQALAANIPNRSIRLDPWPFVPEGCVERNHVERLIGKLKQFRRVGTRDERQEETFRGIIHFALGFIRLRAAVKVSRA
jgi:transposase